MNAPINHSHLLDINDAVKWRAQEAQPQIDPTLALLASGFEHGGLRVDLYGSSDKAGIEVEDVALRGSTVSIGNLFSNKQIEDMSYWCERQATRRAAQDAADNFIDRVFLARA